VGRSQKLFSIWPRPRMPFLRWRRTGRRPFTPLGNSLRDCAVAAGGPGVGREDRDVDAAGREDAGSRFADLGVIGGQLGPARLACGARSGESVGRSGRGESAAILAAIVVDPMDEGAKIEAPVILGRGLLATPRLRIVADLPHKHDDAADGVRAIGSRGSDD